MSPLYSPPRLSKVCWWGWSGTRAGRLSTPGARGFAPPVWGGRKTGPERQQLPRQRPQKCWAVGTQWTEHPAERVLVATPEVRPGNVEHSPARDRSRLLRSSFPDMGGTTARDPVTCGHQAPASCYTRLSTRPPKNSGHTGTPEGGGNFALQTCYSPLLLLCRRKSSLNRNKVPEPTIYGFKCPLGICFCGKLTKKFL